MSVNVAVSMPIFSAQKKSGSDRGTKSPPGAGPGGGGGGGSLGKKAAAGATPPLPPPPADPRPAPGSVTRSAVPSRQELVFHCQLAHGSPTREIKDFSNVQELYARIAAAFDMSPDQVCMHTCSYHKEHPSKVGLPLIP